MPQQLQERLLHHVFRVLMVPQQRHGEAVNRCAVLPEQLLGGERGGQGRFHRGDNRWYNAETWRL